jgi:hypothetical protein
MKRFVLRAMFALTAVAMALTASAATAAENVPFLAEHVESFQGFWRQYQVWSGPGAGTVLGKFSVVALLQDKPADGPHIAAKVAGSMTITAGKGDDLLYVDIIQTQQGTEWLGPGKEWTGSFTIAGGTGRFADATGSGTAFTVENSDGTVTTTFDGTIAF